MSIKSVCKALFCFNCNKPGEGETAIKVTILPESKIEVPMPPVKPTKEDITYHAFRFRYVITHMQPGKEGDVVTPTSWSSELYFNYKEAVEKSRKIVKDITDDLNAHRDVDLQKFFFHLDFSARYDDILTVSANDVQLVVVKNGKMIEVKELVLSDGENLMLQKPADTTLCYLVGE